MTARLPSLLAVAAVVLLAACGCGRPVTPPVDAGTDDDAGFDAGVADAGIDAGPGEVDAGVDAGPPPELKVTRVLPPRGSSAGGTAVLIEGSGFLRDFATSGSAAKPLTSIKFASNPVLDFQIIDDESIELRTPPGATGNASVTIVNPNGTKVCNNCFTYFDELVITGFTPREGPLAGGTELTITGQGFTADTQVLVGGLSSPRITLVSPTQLKAITPRGAAADLVDVVAYNKNGVSTQRRAFAYVADLRVTSVVPATGPVTGGTTVTLTGQGFTGATAVTFGTLAATSFTVESDTRLTAVTPAASAGAVDVSITTPREARTTRRAFTYFDAAGPFALFALFPHVVTPGQVVTLTGQALDQGALAVSIGGVAATVGARTFSTAVITIPPRGAAPRLSDVRAVSSTTKTLVAGATWQLALTSLTPATGPSAGGTPVTVAATALPAAVDTLVGALPAAASTVAGETQLSFTTPPGSGGAASDLVVREQGDPENEAVLPGAFTYLEPLTIGRVQPERGAIAGGTLVTVLGSGFGDATVISFGPSKAKDVKFIDTHTLSCRTPKADVGVVDVTATRLTQTDTLPGGFSYFDPRSISGGLSGGPLVGTINVTVLSGDQQTFGAPIPLASVVLGTDLTTPFQGLTDQRGQLTLSDPSLVKAQTVTVFKKGFSSATVTSVNAENLTVLLIATGGGDGNPGPPPPGVPASIISGRVTGFKSPRPLKQGEALEARVFVAQSSLYSGPPFGGPPNKAREKWRITADGGDYLVFSGAGLRAVYAVLGIWNASATTFEPLTMGVHRGVTTSADNPATGQDIVLDIQLDLKVPITIDSPVSLPSMTGPQPSQNSVYAWLDLGAEGFIPNPNNWNTGLGAESSVTSLESTLVMPNFPQLDGTNFIFLNEAAAVQIYPVSYYFRRQPGDLRAGVTIGPMLPPATLTAPLADFTGLISWSTEPGGAPDLHNVQLIKPTPGGNLKLWDIVLPGNEQQVVLPQPVVDALKRDEAGNSMFFIITSSRAPKFGYSQWTYNSLSVVSWSAYTITVSNPFTP